MDRSDALRPPAMRLDGSGDDPSTGSVWPAAGNGASGSARDLAREVLIRGPISRADLGRRLGLSPASLTRLSKPLLDAGVLIEAVDRADGAVGRPVRPLDLRVDAAYFVGIKLTGTSAEAVLTDLRANQIAEVHEPLPSREPSAVVDVLGRLVETLSSESVLPTGGAQVSAVGVSLGGKVLDSRRVIRAPFLDWRDVDLGGMLLDRVGVPVIVENDLVALAAAEHWFGRGRGMTDFAVVTIGAGVGYGLVSRNRVVDIPDAGLGLGGHIPLPGLGPACVDCGQPCTSSIISIPGIEAAYLEAGGAGRYADILASASGDDPVASEVIDRAVNGLGRLIALVANIAMVSDIILAGDGLALLDDSVPALERAIGRDRDPEADPIRLLVDDSGFAQWARGAAAVAIQDAVQRYGR